MRKFLVVSLGMMAAAMAAGAGSPLGEPCEVQSGVDMGHEDEQAIAAIESGHPELVRLFKCSKELKERARIAKKVKDVKTAWGKISSGPSKTTDRTRSRRVSVVEGPIVVSGERIGMGRDVALRYKAKSRADKKRPTYRYKDPRPVTIDDSSPTAFFDELVAFVAKGDGGEGFRRRLEESRAKFASEDPMLHDGPPCEFCDLGLSHDTLGQRLLIMILQDEGYEAYWMGRVAVVKDPEAIDWAMIRAKIVQLAIAA